MTDTKADMGTLVDVPLKELYIDHDFNHRGNIAPIDVADFARALDKEGLQNPITVRPYSNPAFPQYKYTVVSGHRRSMAFKILKRETIPGFVKLYSNEFEARKASLIENIHRKDLNIKQEAHALKIYLDAFWSENDIAEFVGQSRGWVRIRVMLLNLPEKIQDIAAAGLITQEHIKQMQGKSESQMFEFVRMIKEAKERGEKITPDTKPKAINPHALKPKGREEVFAKITELYEIMGGMGFWARCMSWCAGQISEYELMKDVETWAQENGKSYRIPNEMLLAKIQ